MALTYMVMRQPAPALPLAVCAASPREVMQ